MDHAVRATGDHDVGVAAADELAGFTHGLGAGGAGCQCVEIGAASVKAIGDVAGGAVGILLELANHGQAVIGDARPARGVERVALAIPARDRRRDEIVEIDRAFAAAEVDADLRRVGGAGSVEPGRAPGHLRRAEGESGVASGIFVIVVAVAKNTLEVEALNLCREMRRKRARVKDLGRADAALAVQQALPDRVDVVPQRRDPAHSSDDHSSLHRFIPRGPPVVPVVPFSLLRIQSLAACQPNRISATRGIGGRPGPRFARRRARMTETRRHRLSRRSAFR